MAIELTTATTEQLSAIRQSLILPIITDIFPNAILSYTSAFGLQVRVGNNLSQMGNTFNARGFERVGTIGIEGASGANSKIDTLLNIHALSSLEDVGTLQAFNISNNNLSQTTIDQLFTDLPATSKTATINVRNNPGATTCDTSIATNKGYTVVTE